MILRFAKELTQAMRDEKFREFCDLTSQTLNVSIEHVKTKESTAPGDFVLIGTHTDPTLELDLDSEEPIRLDGFECVFIPRAEADVRDLKSSPVWSQRFKAQSVDKSFAGLKLNDFIMTQVIDGPNSGLKGASFSDRYHFVIKILGH